MTADASPQLGSMYGNAASATFLGLPSASLTDAAKADIAILGAATATPYPSVGAYCADGPKAIRAGIANWAGARDHMDFDLGGRLLPDGVTALDCGDLVIHPADAPANRTAITNAVKTLLTANTVPVLLGGDDSVVIPWLHAFADHAPISVLQIDAHIDWRDEVQGINLGLSSPMRRASEMGWIDRIIQVGARGAGSARTSDYQDARKAGVVFITGRQVAADGIGPAIDAIPRGARLVITLDCDGLDPSVIPGVIGPAPGGLSYWQTVELLHGAAQRATIAGFDIVELVPQLDVQQRGALVAARLVANAIGLIARQRNR